MGSSNFATMLRASVVFLIGVAALGLLSTASAWVKIPTVKRVDCSSILGGAVAKAGYDECIFVIKSNGDRYAGLHYYKGKSDIKNGTLLKEDGEPDLDAPVAVTEDPVSALGFVYMSLSDYPSSKQFTAVYVQIDTGVGHILGVHRVDIAALIRNAPHSHDQQGSINAPRTPVSQKGYQLRHQFVVDLNFVEHVGDVQENLDRLIVHSMVYYQHPSLLTKIQMITNPEPIYVDQRWVAGGENLLAFSRTIKENPDRPEADAYTLLSYDDGTMYGLLGLGNVQCVCHPDRSLKASIVEYLGNELDTAIAVVHEIGHNLGMFHDFDVNPTDLTEVNRYDSNGEKCTDEGGIMDYNQEYSRWTQCSSDDFQNYFDRNQPYCLLEIGEVRTTPAPTTTTPMPTALPPSPCVDYWPKSKCHEHNMQCNNDWTVTYNCLETCQYCRDGPTTCYDNWPADYCENRRNTGICSKVETAINCRKSCNLCQ